MVGQQQLMLAGTKSVLHTTLHIARDLSFISIQNYLSKWRESVKFVERIPLGIISSFCWYTPEVRRCYKSFLICFTINPNGMQAFILLRRYICGTLTTHPVELLMNWVFWLFELDARGKRKCTCQVFGYLMFISVCRYLTFRFGLN